VVNDRYRIGLFLSAIGDLPFCRLGIAPPGPKVRIAVLILAASSGDSPYARQPQSEANGKIRHPQLTSGGQLSLLLHLEGDDSIELKGSAARLKSLPASWARTTRESHTYGELPPIFLMID
jgi:hypothetical protein